jgi:hypothetical protein
VLDAATETGALIKTHCPCNQGVGVRLSASNTAGVCTYRLGGERIGNQIDGAAERVFFLSAVRKHGG